MTRPTRVQPGQRPDCIACQRPFGRHRAVAEQLLGRPVCDQCWHLAGGAATILARLKGEAEGPVLEFDERADAMLAAANPQDLLHPFDRMAVRSGVRWSTLRTIIPRDRNRLTGMIADRADNVPAHTKIPTGGVDWLLLVTDRIAGDVDQFRQRRGSKRRRWWRIARVFALCADRKGRPLTWAAHEVVAEAVGCSTKTVQRCLRWLERQGLLWEVVPGCVLRRSQVPENETPAERDARQKRETLAQAEAIVDNAARRIHIKAELDAVRAGKRGLAALAAADEQLADQADLLPRDPLLDLDLDHLPGDRSVPLWDKNPEQWVRITPVYELRVPLPAAERAEAERITAACGPPPPTEGRLLAELHRADWLHPRNAHHQPDAVLITHDGWCGLVSNDVDPDAFRVAVEAVTSGNAAALVRTSSFVHPPKVSSTGEIKSRINHLWMDGRAPRGSSKKSLGNPSDDSVHTEITNHDESSPKRQVKPLPEARRVARWLIRSGLDPVLCEGLDDAFEGILAAVIAGSGLLRHDWGDKDFRDEIHGLPEHRHLPRWVRNPQAWILSRLRAADPHLPPWKREKILDVERTSRWFAENRTFQAETERAARRATIDACPLCDHNGILDLGEDTPKVRCNHDPDSGGW